MAVLVVAYVRVIVTVMKPILLLILTGVIYAANAGDLAQFKSDGCIAFPDG